MDVVVDDLDIPNERLAWMQVAEDLRKPVYLRTETESSRILTLISRLQFVRHLTFQERFALTKVASFRSASAGEVLLTARGHTRLLALDGADDPNHPTNLFASAKLGGSGAGTGRSKGSPKRPPARFGQSDVLGASSDPLHIPRPEHVYLIVFGTVGLRVETVNGRVQSVLGKGDAVGNPLLEEALPPGSQFVALEPVELLVFARAQFDELLAQVDAAELRARVQFLKGLTVPILQPWGDDEVERLARACYPMRLQSKELVVKEGSVGDAMYFLQYGKLKVVREVDFSTSSGSTALNGGAPFIGAQPTQASYAPMVKLLELATLQEGEFFGELSLIRYRVDENRRTNILKLLASTSSDLMSSGGGSGGGSRHGKPGGGGRSKSVSGALGGAPPSPLLGGGGGAAAGRSAMLDLLHTNGEDSGEDSGDDASKEMTESKPALTRQATIYAHTPATVLVLPRRCFLDQFRGPVLVRVREYAKGYPSQQDIRNHFLRQERWDAFKADLVTQVRGTNNEKAHKGAGVLPSSVPFRGGGICSGGGGGNAAGAAARRPSMSPRRNK